MHADDLQTILERFFETISEQHVCDDDCRTRGCDSDETWNDIDNDQALADCRVRNYGEGGYLARDAGVVLRTPAGDEFQITIVQTRHASD